MKIGLLPLDERPVNTRYPQAVGQIAGAQVLLPPVEALSHFRQRADSLMLQGWLEAAAPELDALVVSFEMLGYGGLIASRTTDDSIVQVLDRLQVLSRLKGRFAGLPILGFNLISRVSNADSAVEEPDYWAFEGRRLYRYSQLLDQAEQGLEVGDELTSLSAGLPPQHIQDFLLRRLRNHAVNLDALHRLSRGELELLVLSSDDTSPFGMPSSDKRILSTWAKRLELNQRLLMYPGADEVGTALVARLLNQDAGCVPAFEPFYAVPGGESITAPYEDGPVSLTVDRQVRAVGGRVAEPGSKADFFLAVNPPVPRRSEWDPVHAEQERRERLPHLLALARQINQRLADGQAVIVADVAYPNGSDPVLVEILFEQVQIASLAAYGAWNTAGNTIGVALGQACAAHLATTIEQRQAQQRFLLHRFLEDWGYQQVVRRATRLWLTSQFGSPELQPENKTAALEFIHRGMEDCLGQIPGFDGYGIKSGSLRLPWNRLFEVDFEITALQSRTRITSLTCLTKLVYSLL